MSSTRSNDYQTWVRNALSGAAGLDAFDLYNAIGGDGDRRWRCERAKNGHYIIEDDFAGKLVLTEREHGAMLAFIENEYMGGSADAFHATMHALLKDKD